MSKKLVNSDFKNHRVEDPTHISSRQEKNVKKYVKEFFDKAVAKKKEHDKKKLERKAKDGGSIESPVIPTEIKAKKEEEEGIGEDVAMSDDEDVKEERTSLTPMTPATQITNGDGLKRKREPNQDLGDIKLEDDDATPSKRPRSITPPAPPPPPPPAEGVPLIDSIMDDAGEQNGDSIHDSSLLWNSNAVANNETLGDEEQMGIDYQPPPPPPPPIDGSIKISYDEMATRRNASRLAAFKSPASPSSTEDGMLEDQDRGLHRNHLRYLKAQEGV